MLSNLIVYLSKDEYVAPPPVNACDISELTALQYSMFVHSGLLSLLEQDTIDTDAIITMIIAKIVFFMIFVFLKGYYLLFIYLISRLTRRS